MTYTKQREYYLDWIRVIIVLLLIPFHSAVSFSHIGKGYIYNPVPIDSPLYIFLSDFLNLWFMRMLFFISGIASYMALQKRTIREFIRERQNRLLLPVLFVILTIGPCSAYLLAINHYDFSGSFLEFYPQFFIHPRKYLFWGHMWFCVYLFIYSLSFIPLHLFLKSKNDLFGKICWFIGKGNHIFLPMLVVMALEIFLRPSFPGYQSFWGDWANVSIYFTFFLLGYITGKDTCVIVSIHKKRIAFLAIAIISTVLHITFKRVYISSTISAAFWGSGAYSWVMFFLAFFRKYLNRSSNLLKILSNSSFSLYLFHYLLISIFNFILIPTGINHYIVWFISTISTYSMFFTMYKFILKNMRIFRFLGGIKT